MPFSVDSIPDHTVMVPRPTWQGVVGKKLVPIADAVGHPPYADKKL